ncbi:MAG: hypothetical protein ACOX50_01020 [Patescibacteria group bacterium]|jgi:hypothetical protein
MTSEIYCVESKRVAGMYRNALNAARENGEIDPATLHTLTASELENKMRYWRLWTVTLQSLAKRSLTGDQAAEYLMEARGVISTYYNNQIVVEVASKMRQDAEDHEYEMLAEMWRDKAQQMEILAALTGSSPFLQRAVDFYGEAIQAATFGGSAFSLATMERLIVERRLGPRIDFSLQAPFTQEYLRVVELSPQAGGADRKAAASWLYTHEAIIAGNKEAVKLGIRNIEETGVPWLKKYLIRDLVKPVADFFRRATFTKNPSQMVV